MATLIGLRALNRSSNVRVGGLKLSQMVTTYVDIDQIAVRQDLAHHSAVGQYIVTDSLGGSGRELGYAEITTDDINATGGTRDVAGLSTTVTVGTRPIIVEFGSGGVKDGTLNNFIDVQIREGGTTLVEGFAGGTTASATFPILLRRRLNPTAGSTHTYKVTSAPLSVGTVTVAAAATNPAWIQVTEV